MRRVFLILLSFILISGCNNNSENKLTGEIKLSSQLLGIDSYYLFGYNFQKSEYIKYSFPFSGGIIPDIINIPFKNIDGTISAPGFNAPSGKNGFNLLGDFTTLEDAREFFKNYREAEINLPFSVDSDTVKLYQVWLQKTQLDHYAKMLITNINFNNGGLTEDYVVVTIEFAYRNDGSPVFP